jgi:hypothetical protein
MKHVAPHATRNFRTEVGSSTRRAHPGVARRSAAERPVGGFWPGIYVVKKGHARDIYFLLQSDAQFLALQRPLFSLYVLLSTRQQPAASSAFHRLHWLL